MNYEESLDLDREIYGQITQEEAWEEFQRSMRQFDKKLSMTEAGKILATHYVREHLRIPEYGGGMEQAARDCYVETAAAEYIKQGEESINSGNPEDGGEFTIPPWDSKDGNAAQFWMPRYFFS